jgi:hypothetical protein
MKRLLGVLAAMTVVGCGAGANEYLNNDLVLASGHGAKDMCSCLFVMNMSQAFCEAYTAATPAIARYAIDWKAKAVDSSALALWGARAHYVGPHFGCVLE